MSADGHNHLAPGLTSRYYFIDALLSIISCYREELVGVGGRGSEATGLKASSVERYGLPLDCLSGSARGWSSSANKVFALGQRAPKRSKALKFSQQLPKLIGP